VRSLAFDAALQLFWAETARQLHGRVGSRYKPSIQRNFLHVLAYSGYTPVGLGKGPYE
jgi:hypothetical protein